MANLSRHECAGPVDLVVAVTARHHGLTLLHLDRDFEVVAKLTGQPVERIDARRPPPERMPGRLTTVASSGARSTR
ncbi:PIN domain-containing protein [Embleya sp. NPDC056575]|uniref:PIN domain-containing protein n=1 Tax=unclassified Embleya TaxID=2699296 RepID=UPI003699AA7F